MSVTTDTPPETRAPASRSVRTHRLTPGLRRALPWMVAALAVAVAVLSTLQWQRLAAQERARDEVARTAAAFVTTLTTWDASGGLAETRDALRAAGTGPFLDEIDRFFGGSVGDDLEAQRAVSEGRIDDVFVQPIDGDRAEALVVATQRIRSDASPQELRMVRYAALSLHRSDGTWLVSSVELLGAGDASTPGAQRGTRP